MLKGQVILRQKAYFGPDYYPTHLFSRYQKKSNFSMQKKSHNLELKISNNKILCLLWKFSFSECSNMILWLDMFKRQTGCHDHQQYQSGLDLGELSRCLKWGEREGETGSQVREGGWTHSTGQAGDGKVGVRGGETSVMRMKSVSEMEKWERWHAPPTNFFILSNRLKYWPVEL